MLEQHEEVELGEMELEIRGGKVNPMISSPDSTCWQIEQAWEPDMFSFDFFYFLLLLWRTLLFRVTLVVLQLLLIINMIIKNLTSGVIGPCGSCSELYYDFHPERGTSNVVKKAVELENVSYALADDSTKTKLKIIRDHMRAGVYLISDGVNPQIFEGDMWYVALLEGFSEQAVQSALKRVIGQETSKVVSMVASDRLIFDFNFHRPVLDKELVEIEGLINQMISDGIILETKVMSLTDAKRVGEIAMFGEK
ncbi:hypothetical protein CQW23_23803 [Capsicum baccatum]|uniref:Uncharacterized protein n=1 Tax=Capsicum baccatum TaxID=33114 RepID=A0A2G2VT30_CAPBA|nr:hypothetical protein CQW23_23803 [Capsicum baccatum]